MELFSRLFYFIRVIFKRHKPINLAARQSINLRIIDNPFRDVLTIQVINTKAILTSSVYEVACNVSILNKLSALQSCFVGIEYSKLMLDIPEHMSLYFSDSIDAASSNVDYRYKIKYMARKGKICFIDKLDSTDYYEDPVELVFFDDIISSFHPLESFYIGICAGHRFINQKNNVLSLDDYRLKQKEKAHKHTNANKFYETIKI